jgi:hypothetical protein
MNDTATTKKSSKIKIYHEGHEETDKRCGIQDTGYMISDLGFDLNMTFSSGTNYGR